MLKVPKLDDLTYEQMMQRAVSRIPSMTEEWTDFNHHDPGITVLQMYAWLTDMLDYYMRKCVNRYIFSQKMMLFQRK